MADILGVGMTHAPMFQFPDENMADILRNYLASERAPEWVRDKRRWPAPMVAEWEEGIAAARRHREQVVDGFRRLRATIDEFAPDAVLIWGDDQYENFREDLVPPFCVYIAEGWDCLPFRGSRMVNTSNNVWHQPVETRRHVRGHPEVASLLTRELLKRDFDVAFSMRPLHWEGLAHAFIRTLLYLDYDLQGFPYPMVPFHVNCYGSDLLRNAPVPSAALLPPAPTPRRCYDLGRAVAEILTATPWRVVLIGSSSWSHAFLTRKHGGLYPDVESDRQRLAELQSGTFATWRALPLDTLTDAGQHEFLNWVCLAGAMEGKMAQVVAWAETYVFNSDKCCALFL